MTPLDELLDDLAHMPRLTGAACRDHADVFDTAAGCGPGSGTARKTALAICGDCHA